MPGRVGPGQPAIAARAWDSFTLNTPTWMNGLPGDGESDLGEPLDGFATHHELVARLERHAWRWDLPVREETAVERVVRAAPPTTTASTTSGCPG